jgi:tRNA pseudouridine13 synthase
MKLKQQPEDFRVEEITRVVPGPGGAFGFYRLEKRGWATLDAMQAIRRRWHLRPDQLSCAGIKDRHAQTVQFLTIRDGPRRGLTHHQVTLHYLGQIDRPYRTLDIVANRFDITLRALRPEEIAPATSALEEIRAQGIPNYFDDQRFGSVLAGSEFVARHLILGRFEDALRLALTAPYTHDRAESKREKEILLAHWGNWAQCKAALPRGDARILADYLVHHPSDFRGAIARMHHDLASLYLAAYQSYLWNRILACRLKEVCAGGRLVYVPLRLGAVPMYRLLEEAQRAALEGLLLPLPSARLKLDPDDPRAALYESVLEEAGFHLRDMRIRGLRELFFSKGQRPALCMPAQLSYLAATDELAPQRRKLRVSFELPRGSYATLLVKRIQHGSSG